MPPKGLWPIPRHHLYDGTPRRRTFNAKDFESIDTGTPKEDMASQESAASALARFEAQLEDPSFNKKKKKKKEKRKEKKKEKKEKKLRVSSNSEEKSRVNITGATSSFGAGSGKSAATPSTRTAVSSNTKAKRSSSKEDIEAPAPNPLSKSAKKRKRQSETGMAAPASMAKGAGNTKSGDFVIGVDMLKNIESSMAGLGDHFRQNVVQPSKKPKKARKESSKKATIPADIDDQAAKSTLSLLGSIQIDKNKVIGKSSSKKMEKEDKDIAQDMPRTPSSVKKTAIPLPSISSTKTPTATLAASPFTKEAFESMQLPSTPRPLTRQLAPPHAMEKPTVEQSNIIVPETPPSSAAQAPRTYIKTPIPLPSLTESKTHPFKKLQRSTSELGDEATVQGENNEPSSKLEQIVYGEPKPKLQRRNRTSRASSVASVSSKSSSVKSVSIIDLFNRRAKPYARSGVGEDPFATPQSKKSKPQDSQEEAQLKDFNDRFALVLQSVNFAAEQEYLNQHLDWYIENGTEYPFPCLGRVSGCTPKKEEALRLSKENASIMSTKKTIATSGGDTTALHEVTERANKAEQFLMLAIRARVPVPIGCLEGSWTLYCPEYSVHHYDRYGYGARTLTISSIAGLHDKNAYTARLSIPPRSITYSILTFSVPPHASFRTTVLKTAQEGYTMDAIFIGNGFLQLRVDLNLLLTGKSTEMVGGRKVYMEFIGVHEKAVEWVESKDDVEEEGRKLFARYGGVDDD